MMRSFYTTVAFVALLVLCPHVSAQQCNESLADYLGDSNTWFTGMGVDISGFKDSLPNPGEVPLTLLVPTNGAWARFAYNNGFFVHYLSSLGSKLTSVVAYMIFPTALSPADAGRNGTTQTLYGLLNGTYEPLHHWTSDDGQILFQGAYDDKIAGVSEYHQVCNSYVYIVDEVLRPTYDLGDIHTVNMSELSSLSGLLGSGSSSSSNSSSSGNSSDSSGGGDSSTSIINNSGNDTATNSSSSSGGGGSSSPSCSVSDLVSAAQGQGLSLLATILGQDLVKGALPTDLGAQPLTVFAPTNDAFFTMLSTLNLSIADALKLGDKLAGVLAYHMVPEAVPPESLPKQDTLPTILGQRMGNTSSFQLGVGSENGQVVMQGIYPGNQATVTGNFTLCGDIQAYIIDHVLIPANSLADLPSLPSSSGTASNSSSTESAISPAPAEQAQEKTEEPAADMTSLHGVAVSSGYLANCTVQLQSGGANGTAVTDASGRFALDCGSDGCGALANASVLLPTAGQSANCKDSATGLPPFYQLGVQVIPANLSASGGGSEAQPLTVGAAQALPVDAQLAAADPAEVAGEYYELVARLLGLQNASAAAFGNPVQGTLDDNADAANLQIFSQQLAITVGVGAATLTPLAPAAGAGIPLQAVSRAVLQAAVNDSLSLTSADAISELLQTALDTLPAGGADNNASSSGDAAQGSAGSVGGRRLLLGRGRHLTQNSTESGNGSAASAAPAPEPVSSMGQQQVLSSVGEVVATLCGLLNEAQAARTSGSIETGAQLLEVVARTAAVAQSSIAPAAAELASGQMSAANFTSQFDQTGLSALISAVNLQGNWGQQ